MITDRNLYRVGEIVHVKGFIRKFNSLKKIYDSSSLPSTANIMATWHQTKTESSRVDIDSTYGTFETTLQIPEDAEYGTKTIQLYYDNFNSYTSILIADPRIPTGVM